MSLKFYRKQAGLTQIQLSDEAEVSQAQITHHECGRRSNISLNQARRIVEALRKHGAECSLDDVFPPSSEDSEAA